MRVAGGNPAAMGTEAGRWPPSELLGYVGDFFS